MTRFRTEPFPWRRPRFEPALLALVAIAALSQVYPPDTQDVSRICLARAVVAERLNADACLASTLDRARHGGHLYSNKAPGMSVLEIPAELAVRLPPHEEWSRDGSRRLWAVRLFASGLPYLLCCFLVGRIAEGLAPGFGGITLVTFGLGTLVAPLAVAGFSHVLTAALAFLAFVLAWRRQPFLSGLSAGAALTTGYEAAAILVVLAAYVVLQGRVPLGRFVVGALPGTVLLGAYDWSAFGAPWRSAERYAANSYAAQESSGLLGIHQPNVDATRLVFVGERGLLIASPVLLAAAAGLVLLWRRGLRAEAITCAAVTAVFVVAECGYFLPYGGTSPGPRFLIPSLPFLAVGIGPAFERFRIPTTILAAISVVATTAVTLTWFSQFPYRETIWGELARISTQGRSAQLAVELTRNILIGGSHRGLGAAFVALCATTAFVLSLYAARRPPRVRGA